MITTLAKGGAPSGQICPNNTTVFNIIKIMRTIFPDFSIINFSSKNNISEPISSNRIKFHLLLLRLLASAKPGKYRR